MRPADGKGEIFTRSQIGAVMSIALLSGITAPLQPLLLGPLAATGRLTYPQIGYAAMIEGGGMMLISAWTGAFLKPEQLKRIAIMGAALALLANAVTTILPGPWILAARGIGGAGAGLLLFLYAGLMARLKTPARIAAAYNVGQSILALCLTSLISTVLIPWFGPTVGYVILMLFNLATMLLVLHVPGSYPAPASGSRRALPSPLGMVAILTVALQIGAIIGAWVYAMPLAQRAGLDTAQGGLVLSLMLAVQIVAGLTLTTLAHRLDALSMLAGGMLIGLLALTCILLFPNGWGFAGGLIFFGIAWSCSTPFQMQFLLKADPGRGAAMQIITAQLAGVAGGPMLTAMAIAGHGLPGAAMMGCALFAMSLLLVVTVGTASHRRRKETHA
jgi:predicted MFS family arabinose efflux permease